MDWIATVVSIRNKLTEHGFSDTASRITEAQMVLGTPGEMYLAVMNELLHIRKNHTTEYQLIEREVNELLDYGKSINYFNPRE